MTADASRLAGRIANTLLRLLPTADWTDALARDVAQMLGGDDPAQVTAVHSELQSSRHLLSSGPQRKDETEERLHEQWQHRLELILASMADPAERADSVLSALQAAGGGIRSGWHQPAEGVVWGGDSNRTATNAPDEDEGASPARQGERFLACDVPENVRAASEFLVLVRITEFQQGASVPLLIPDIPVRGARVYVAVDVPPGCEVVTDAVVSVTVPRRGDSDEAWFVIRSPNSCGPCQITITAVWGHGRSQLLAREPFKVMVHDAPTDPMKTRLWPARSDGADPEVAVLVVSRISARRYKYVLCRPGHSPVTDDLRMDADPRSKLSRLTSDLSQMARGDPGWRPGGLHDELRARGNDLWRDFLPPLVREALNGMRAGHDRLTISCTNSTLAVPWEMFHPIDPIAGHSDFLVQLFDLVRSPESTSTWCSKFTLPPAVIVLPDDQLPGALDEARVISEMLGSTGGPYIREKVQLQRRLRDHPFGMLHFAAHDRDGGGNISLAARQRFSPSDLNEFAGTGGQWFVQRPLVFVNACGTNASRQIFTQFTSWAQRFFEAGAGGFIGSMWDVRSATAGVFAERFYYALYVDGRPFSKALHEAREHSRRAADPTWLAYAAHGDHSATAHSSN